MGGRQKSACILWLSHIYSHSYHGGLAAYLDNARRLLQDSKEGEVQGQGQGQGEGLVISLPLAPQPKAATPSTATPPRSPTGSASTSPRRSSSPSRTLAPLPLGGQPSSSWQAAWARGLGIRVRGGGQIGCLGEGRLQWKRWLAKYKMKSLPYVEWW